MLIRAAGQRRRRDHGHVYRKAVEFEPRPNQGFGHRLVTFWSQRPSDHQ